MEEEFENLDFEHLDFENKSRFWNVENLDFRIPKSWFWNSENLDFGISRIAIFRDFEILDFEMKKNGKNEQKWKKMEIFAHHPSYPPISHRTGCSSCRSWLSESCFWGILVEMSESLRTPANNALKWKQFENIKIEAEPPVAWVCERHYILYLLEFSVYLQLLIYFANSFIFLNKNLTKIAWLVASTPSIEFLEDSQTLLAPRPWAVKMQNRLQFRIFQLFLRLKLILILSSNPCTQLQQQLCSPKIKSWSHLTQ